MAGSNPPNAESYAWITNVGIKEASYGTPIADGNLLHTIVPIESTMFEVTPTYRDDSKELTGYAGPTTHDIESWAGGRDTKHYLSPETYQYYLNYLLGNVAVTGGADPYLATNKWPSICNLSPPSTSILEAVRCAGSTSDFILYKGVMCEELDVEVKGLTTITETVKLLCDGSETAKPAVAVPASNFAVQKLVGAYLTFKLGPIGTEDLTPDFRDFKCNIKGSLTRRQGVAAGLYSPGFNYGVDHPMPTVTATFIGDKSHVLWGYMKSKTSLKMDVLLSPGLTPARSIEWKMNQTIVTCKEVAAGSETQIQVTFYPEWNSTDAGPMTILTQTGQSSWLN